MGLLEKALVALKSERRALAWNIAAKIVRETGHEIL